jgi:hypothetical protein
MAAPVAGPYEAAAPPFTIDGSASLVPGLTASTTGLTSLTPSHASVSDRTVAILPAPLYELHSALLI